MIKVVVGNNISSVEVVVPDTTPIAQVLSSQNIPANAAVHLNGTRVTNTNNTFADYGIRAVPGTTTSCFLITVVKSDNANR